MLRRAQFCVCSVWSSFCQEWILAELSSRHYVIVHGYTANPEANWFPWLREQLERAGARVSVPAMPSPHAPVTESWDATLRDLLPRLSDDVVLIGHSLGCITILRYLMSRPPAETAGGYVLVSGFDRRLSTLPELEAFTDIALDYDALRRRAAFRVSVFSDNDAIVDPSVSRDLAKALRTEVMEIPGGGHFLDREGYGSFPELSGLLLTQ
ncbi:serine hydrolase family protein [Acetobacter musti]|uniref:Serine hydrolase family protein n=1 Tax=Acetobacter musti TaxID=864732 RepID=A0ABX0JVH3_9PROT|nr:serine hydrolase family protein [Acetobacter musti]